MSTTQVKMEHNGVDLEALGRTIEMVKDNPELGKSRFCIRNKWLSGGHNKSMASCFNVVGKEWGHDHSLEVDADEPRVLGGTDEGANPVELLLSALASCVTTSMVAHGAAKGIEIEEIESQVEGDIDLRGFFGLDESVPKGFQNIRIKFKVKTAPENIETLKELVKFSPVYNTITNGANVDIHIEPK